MRRILKNRTERSGSALIEALIALALMGTVVGALFNVATTSTKLCETGVTNATLEGNLRRALDRLSGELVGARTDSIAMLPESPLWQDGIDFDRPAAIRAGDGRVTWSSNRLEFRMEAEETDNGLDDDADGLVDEGMLVLVQDAGGADELETVLARHVREYLEDELPNGMDDNDNGLIDERGVAFERVGEELTIYITLEGIGRDGRSVTRTLETSIWSRN